MKKISVVMCTYNGCKYLREQLESIARQTYKTYEIIIQDDKSTDNTTDIIREFQNSHKDLNIKLYINEYNMGFNRNFMSALLKAKGDYIACCDQDDIWEDIKLETLINEADDSMLIFHNSSIFDGQRINGLLHSRYIPEYPSVLSALLSPRSYGHQIMFRKEVLDVISPYSHMNISYDYFIYTACAMNGSIKYINKSLVKWRRHNEAATFSNNVHKESKLDGYKRAVCSLFKKHNLNTTRRYFSLIKDIKNNTADKNAQLLINKMGKVDFANIASICYLCLMHKGELVTDNKGVTGYIRAFFMPLFFIRDYGQYIIKE